MELDLAGRLNVLRVTPSLMDSSAGDEGHAVETVDWAEVFELAGLDITLFEPTTPTVRPESFADTRLAWEGTLPDYDDRPVRIEAASLEGKAVSFIKVISSDRRWSAEEGATPSGTRAGGGPLPAAIVLLLSIFALVIGGALFLAIRNLKLGRGDRKGAFRVATCVFTMRSLHWVIGGDHAAHPAELEPLATAFSGAIALAALAWIVYVACEPYVRRLWPETMIGWTRALSGRLRDPLVGRDVLVGCTLGTVQWVISLAILGYAIATGALAPIPNDDQLVLLRGGRYALGETIALILWNAAFGLVLLALLLILRLVLRKTLFAGAAICLLVAGFFGGGIGEALGSTAGLVVALAFFLISAVLVVGLVRFGLLALVASQVFAAFVLASMFTYDTSRPHFTFGLFVTTVAFAFAFYGWKVSLAGRPLMQDHLMK